MAFSFFDSQRRRPRSGPVRIGYVIGQLTYGGAERQLYELVRRIDRGEFHAFVYCLSGKTEPFGPLIEESGVRLRVLQRRGHFDLSRASELARLFRWDRIDIVHSFLFKANGYAWSARVLAGAPHLVTSARNCRSIGWVGDGINYLAFRDSDAIICNGEEVRSFSARRFRMPLHKSVVIYNGVDLDRFAAVSDSPPDRDGSGPKRIITVGRLVPQKDVGLFLDAAKLIAERYPSVRFLIVGDGPCRAALVRQAADSGLAASVSFLGERSDVPRLLANADIFWLTSRWEGLPNVVLEAMACAKPVVARDVGACRELVRDGVTGFLISGRDAEAFARRTLDLLAKPKDARRFGEAGRRLVEDRFSAAGMAAATQALYRSILGLTGEQPGGDRVRLGSERRS